MKKGLGHPAVMFMVLACGYSWTLWGLMMASAQVRHNLFLIGQDDATV